MWHEQIKWTKTSDEREKIRWEFEKVIKTKKYIVIEHQSGFKSILFDNLIETILEENGYDVELSIKKFYEANKVIIKRDRIREVFNNWIDSFETKSYGHICRLEKKWQKVFEKCEYSSAFGHYSREFRENERAIEYAIKKSIMREDYLPINALATYYYEIGIIFMQLTTTVEKVAKLVVYSNINDDFTSSFSKNKHKIVDTKEINGVVHYNKHQFKTALLMYVHMTTTDHYEGVPGQYLTVKQSTAKRYKQ